MSPFLSARPYENHGLRLLRTSIDIDIDKSFFVTLKQRIGKLILYGTLFSQEKGYNFVSGNQLRPL